MQQIQIGFFVSAGRSIQFSSFSAQSQQQLSYIVR